MASSGAALASSVAPDDGATGRAIGRASASASLGPSRPQLDKRCLRATRRRLRLHVAGPSLSAVKTSAIDAQQLGGERVTYQDQLGASRLLFHLRRRKANREWRGSGATARRTLSRSAHRMTLGGGPDQAEQVAVLEALHHREDLASRRRTRGTHLQREQRLGSLRDLRAEPEARPATITARRSRSGAARVAAWRCVSVGTRAVFAISETVAEERRLSEAPRDPRRRQRVRRSWDRSRCRAPRGVDESRRVVLPRTRSRPKSIRSRCQTQRGALTR